MAHCHAPVHDVLIPSAVLIASLIGSGHCVGMCGGIAVAMSRQVSSLVQYHLGRMVGYVGLGVVFGLIGQQFKWEQSMWASHFFAWAVGLSFIVLGVVYWRDGRMHFPMPRFLEQWMVGASGKLMERSQQKGLNFYPFVIGLMAIFLPCGWLYGYVVASAAMQDPVKGALIMFVFWVGTVPALTVAPVIFNQLVKYFGRHTPKIAAILLMLLGIYTIAFKFFPASGHH